MATLKISKIAATDVHESTLKLAPARLLAFLQGVQNSAIRIKLTAVGLTAERVEEAWNLLHDLQRLPATRPSMSEDSPAAATARCEQWLTGPLVRARAIANLSHPEFAEALFRDLGAERGMNAVLRAATFLSRWDELAASGDKEAAALLAILAEVAVPKASLKALRVDVERAKSRDEGVDPHVDAARQHIEGLRRIYAWITAWSEVARTVIVRRDELIRLGIAKRRASKSAKESDRAEPPVVVAPVVPAPAVPQAISKDVPRVFLAEGPPSSRAA